MKRIGVLALQGAFAEHVAVLKGLGVEAFPVRLPEEMDELDGLVIPGGESSSMTILLDAYALRDKVTTLARGNFPILGTCAGMILLAKEASGLQQPPLGVMDIGVKRNAFGRQVDSFETDLAIPVLGEAHFHAVFIRAPLIDRVGPSVEVLAKLPSGEVVAAQQGNLVVAAFHPELTPDTRFHQYFVRMAEGP
ncbi:MAG: pyridoxal 5'-phosphate synthase glutaminase subunit PdxT [Chloroflexota bacterium]